MAAHAARAERGRLVGGAAMAGVAVELAVPAVERKLGLAVVVEVPGLPVPGVVAGLAARSEPALVHVVLGMAGHALALRVLVARGGVAALAFDHRMPAEQRKVGARVVEAGLLPGLLDVAAVAFRSELPFVLVVLLVAGDARALQLVAIQVARMAAVAFHLPVLAAQRILGLRVVVERDLRPRLGGVAGLAFLPEAALVLVVLLVAADARHRRFLEDVALVAGLAFHRGVLAEQREARLRVIEARLLPARLVVAVGARGAERPFVLVVLLVAGDAGALQLVAVEIARVAALALDLLVLAAQRVLGLRVVVEGDLRPRLGAVAGLALLAEAA